MHALSQETIKKTIAETITRERKRKNLTMTSLAKAVGVSTTQIFRYERGYDIHKKVVNKLGVALSCRLLISQSAKFPSRGKVVFCYSVNGKLLFKDTLMALQTKLNINRKTIESAILKKHLVSNTYFFSVNPVRTIRKEIKKIKRNRLVACFDKTGDFVAKGTVNELADKLGLKSATINVATRKKFLVARCYHFQEA
jgi:transcriptional regulator with XRE-family HTH domain